MTAHRRILTTSIAALLTMATRIHAADYNFGSITENFTLSATDQTRGIGAGVSSGVAFSDNGWGSVYDRGVDADRDATYIHFNLSTLAGGTINGTASLNLTIDATYGGAINSGVVGSATNAWSYPGTTGGITTISGANFVLRTDDGDVFLSAGSVRSVSIKDTRYSIPVMLLADLAGIIFSILICYFLWK